MAKKASSTSARSASSSVAAATRAASADRFGGHAVRQLQQLGQPLRDPQRLLEQRPPVLVVEEPFEVGQLAGQQDALGKAQGVDRFELHRVLRKPGAARAGT